MADNFEPVIAEIRRIAIEWSEKLLSLPPAVIIDNRNRQGRNIKMIVGHMIDSACNNHQRMVRMQYTSNLVFPDYTLQNDMWIGIQQHQTENWEEMVLLWKYYNLHIAHIISNIDKGWLNNIWTDGNHEPVTLNEMILDYPAHLSLHLNEIRSLMVQSNQAERAEPV